MKAAVNIGIKPHEFWNMTPAEMIICGEIYEEKADEQFKTAMIAAWFNARWILEQSQPDFNVLMNVLDGNFEPKEEAKEMTDEEIFSTIKVLNAAFGGEVIDTRKGGEMT